MCSTADPSNTFISGAVLLSGVYDLRPLLHTTVNDPLQLAEDDAIGLSPQLHAVSPIKDIVIAWGEHETTSFKDQSRNYAQHLTVEDCNVTQIEVEGCDHFDVIYDLVTPVTPLGAATLRLLHE
jgi:arylformamidase